MTAALAGLIGWKDLQVVLTKKPIDKDGNSLAPKGLDLKVVRYFPLAQVLRAFDAGVCATGYNGVHELLPAQLPTVFVSNIRGTDDKKHVPSGVTTLVLLCAQIKQIWQISPQQ